MTLDGRRAVSVGGHDKTLRVWDLGSGACLRTLEGHSSYVRGVSVTPDGVRAISASEDKTLRVWDLESGACLRTLEGHSHWVMGVSVTPDGRRAVSASWDQTLRVWDLESGACLRTLVGHRDRVEGVSVTPDGRRAVSASRDKTLRVWDPESGACLAVFSAAAPLWAPCLGAAGRVAAVGTTTGEVIFLGFHGLPNGPSVCTATWRGEPFGRAACHCPACGEEFAPAAEIISTIQALSRDLRPDQSPCLDLPAGAFDDPHLLSACPRCDESLKLNPFLMGMKKAASHTRAGKHKRWWQLWR